MTELPTETIPLGGEMSAVIERGNLRYICYDNTNKYRGKLTGRNRRYIHPSMRQLRRTWNHLSVRFGAELARNLYLQAVLSHHPTRYVAEMISCYKWAGYANGKDGSYALAI